MKIFTFSKVAGHSSTNLFKKRLHLRLFPACCMSEICNGEDLWQWSRLEIRLNAFCLSAIPQKQMIIIMNSKKLRIPILSSTSGWSLPRLKGTHNCLVAYLVCYVNSKSIIRVSLENFAIILTLFLRSQWYFSQLTETCSKLLQIRQDIYYIHSNFQQVFVSWGGNKT